MEATATVTEESGKSILKKYETDIIKWVVGCALVILGTGVTFYFTAKDTLQVHGEKIDKLDNRVSEIEQGATKMAIEPAVNSEQIEALSKLTDEQNKTTRKMIDDVKDDIRLIKEKQDKTYDILLEMSKRRNP